VIFFVMVFVPYPQKTMHDIFVAKPCHKFHSSESQQKNS
jgi:hypothetical protein